MNRARPLRVNLADGRVLFLNSPDVESVVEVTADLVMSKDWPIPVNPEYAKMMANVTKSLLAFRSGTELVLYPLSDLASDVGKRWEECLG